MYLAKCVLPFPYDRFVKKIDYLDYLGLGISFDSLLTDVLHIVFFNYDLEDYVEYCIDSIFSKHVDNDTFSTAIVFFCEFTEELISYFTFATSINVNFDTIENLKIDVKGNSIYLDIGVT